MHTPWVSFDSKNCGGCKHLNERGYCEFTACIIPCTVRATIPEVKPQIYSTNRTNSAIGGEKRTMLLINGIETPEEEVSFILNPNGWDEVRDANNVLLADARPVVLCRDCKYSYDSVGGWCCSHGICVDCIVREDFFCADGEKREET